MSKTNYKRLGDYIREVDVRNRDLKVTKLYGVNLQKEFMPSVANIIGTDLSKYKIVSYNQFGCKLMSVERDHKLPISLMKESQPAIMSSAYFVFEVIDENVLNPDYLFMQIKRPEFDRRLWFSTGGDVRGGATWDNLCDMPIIVPSIDQQRKIVAEYNAIQQRIKLNEQQIVKLEETAQAIYRKMFVDGIDKNNLPEGWRMGTLGEIADFGYGKMPDKTTKGDIPIFSGYGIVGYTDTPMYDKQLIIIIARGDSGSGKVVLSPNIFFLTNLAIAVLLKDDKMKNYLYYHLLNSDTTSLRSGSAQAQVTINSLSSYEIIIPSDEYYNKFDLLISPINEQKGLIINENIKLNKLQSLQLVKIEQ